MTCLTSRVSVLLAFLLLHFWRAKVYASGNSGEEIDFTYVIIGVTLGVFLAIAFIAVIICMIKTQMIDNVFGESDGKLDRRNNKTISGFEHVMDSQVEEAVLDCLGNCYSSSSPRTSNRVEMYRSREFGLQVVC
ncbi:transmembrane protein 273 isoform 1-T1 [Guaruba guarouba]